MTLDDLSKDQLKELVRIYARNIYAIDGLWFQSIEKENGMDAAMHHDWNAWRRFTEVEARRIKKFLKLSEHPGLEGLRQALAIRYSALANRKIDFIDGENSLTYRVIDCRVQSARQRKGLPFHPCKPVGFIEYTYFAKAIDNRIECEAVSCFPDITDESCACAWKFFIAEQA